MGVASRSPENMAPYQLRQQRTCSVGKHVTQFAKTPRYEQLMNFIRNTIERRKKYRRPELLSERCRFARPPDSHRNDRRQPPIQCHVGKLVLLGKPWSRVDRRDARRQPEYPGAIGDGKKYEMKSQQSHSSQPAFRPVVRRSTRKTLEMASPLGRRAFRRFGIHNHLHFD